MHLKMLSAICSNLDLSKILSSDNGLSLLSCPLSQNLFEMLHILLLEKQIFVSWLQMSWAGIWFVLCNWLSKIFRIIAKWIYLSSSDVYSFFSSPEHKVLMVSFCNCPMSGVHNFFKHLLLLNNWANLDETWQGCSLGKALPKLYKRLNSTHNSDCHGNQKEKNSKIFENLLPWN